MLQSVVLRHPAVPRAICLQRRGTFGLSYHHRPVQRGNRLRAGGYDELPLTEENVEQVLIEARSELLQLFDARFPNVSLIQRPRPLISVY